MTLTAKMERLLAISEHLKATTEQVQTRRSYLLDHKKPSFLTPAPNAITTRRHKHNFLRVYGKLLRKLAVGIVIYRFMDQVRHLLAFSRLSITQSTTT